MLVDLRSPTRSVYFFHKIFRQDLKLSRGVFYLSLSILLPDRTLVHITKPFLLASRASAAPPAAHSGAAGEALEDGPRAVSQRPSNDFFRDARLLFSLSPDFVTFEKMCALYFSHPH